MRAGARVLGLCLGAALGLAAGAAERNPAALEPGRPRFRVFAPRDGLPQGTIMSLVFDPRGALWVGTQDGAAWYDGRTWNPVDMPERTISNYVEAVLPASDGSCWFGRQDGGVARLVRGAWQTFTRREGLPAERVTSLAETRDQAGNSIIWAASYGGGLARYSGGRWQVQDTGGELPSGRLWKVLPRPVAGGGEEVWACGEGGGLARVDAQGRVHGVPGLPKVSVNSVLETTGAAGERELWATTFGAGVGHFAGGRWSFLTAREGLPSNFTTDIAETRSLTGKKVIWIATVAGLFRMEEGSKRSYDVHWGLPTDTVYRLQRDPYRPDALWIGTSGGGLLYFQEGGWLTHDGPSGLPGSHVTALAESRGPQGETRILAGTSLGLARYDGRRWETIAMPHSFQATRVTALLEDPGGALWVGTLAGLNRLEGGRWGSLGIREGLPHPAVGCLLRTLDRGQESLWIGTLGGGLANLRSGQWRVHNMRTGLPSDSILALRATQEAGETALWAGFRGGGLGCFKADRWRFWDRRNGLPNSTVSSIHESRLPDGRRELWVGTLGGGVAWTGLDGGDPVWKVLSSLGSPALPSDVVHQIQEDRAGRIYLSTNRGVVRLTRERGTFILENFTEEDGLPSDQCSPAASLVDSRGHVWTGTVLGLGELDPGLPIPEDLARPLVFRAATVREKPHALPEAGAALVLGSRERDLVIDFGLLSYRKEGSQRFRTLLAGRDSSPSAWAEPRRREFTNLAAGSYVFKVWGKDWSGRVVGPLELPIVVRPAFWETWWFRGGLLAGLTCALALGVQWWTGAVVRRAQRLKILVQRQTRELESANLQLRKEIDERIAAEQVKDEFVSMVSHELRTPLTSIRGALGLLEGGVAGPLPAEVGRMVGVAHGNALRLQSLVSDLLDIQKLTTGNVRLNLEPGSLAELVERVLVATEGLARATGVEFRALRPLGEGRVAMDAGRIEQVLANLLSNAAKFSPPGRAVEVRVLTDAAPGRVRVAVTNFGPPISEAFRSRIFTRFAQADSTSARAKGGTGLGLAISRTLIELHGGRIDFESGEEATTFWFELPTVDGGVSA